MSKREVLSKVRIMRVNETNQSSENKMIKELQFNTTTTNNRDSVLLFISIFNRIYNMRST